MATNKTTNTATTKTDEKPTCFCIMPITTPKHLVKDYGEDSDHFRHVYSVLFKPAIEGAGMEAIDPVAEGSGVIPAEIITHLGEADLVLCDISTHNPNVFFELGCRTALDRLVAYVRDDLTEKIPFDNNTVNHHTYDSSLQAWQLTAEIDALKKHLTTCRKKQKEGNALWRYFGVSATGAPARPLDGDEEKFDYIISEIRQLKKSLSPPSSPEYVFGRGDLLKHTSTPRMMVDAHQRLGVLSAALRDVKLDPFTGDPDDLTGLDLDDAVAELMLIGSVFPSTRAVPEFRAARERLFKMGRSFLLDGEESVDPSNIPRGG